MWHSGIVPIWPAKTLELEVWLKNDDVDVALIHELKLVKEDGVGEEWVVWCR